ncbi:hypothetical protein GCM10009549_17310 [Streptomyces thermoalcalitolerans]|uniref:Uncharacterized protein n=1 Tax=Streptomyces thermoalcalitolerans TaxID=65605 RepID=A0ABP3YX25_9ACTN
MRVGETDKGVVSRVGSDANSLIRVNLDKQGGDRVQPSAKSSSSGAGYRRFTDAFRPFLRKVPALFAGETAGTSSGRHAGEARTPVPKEADTPVRAVSPRAGHPSSGRTSGRA